MPSSKKGASQNSYKATYLGGHTAFPKRMKVHLTLAPEFLEIPEFHAKIPYEKIKDVQRLTKDKISTMSLLLTGLLGFFASPLTKKIYMILTYKDEAGIEQNPIFDVDRTEEVQLSILQRMIASSRKEKLA